MLRNIALLARSPEYERVRESTSTRDSDAFQAALRTNNLKAIWGEDASAQPGQLQEAHLHRDSGQLVASQAAGYHSCCSVGGNTGAVCRSLESLLRTHR